MGIETLTTMEPHIEIPYAPASEKTVLSLMFSDSGKWIPLAVGDGLIADHFYFPAHRLMFELLTERRAKGADNDLTLFVQDAMLHGHIDALGGPSGITEVHNYAFNGSSYSHHVRVLRDFLARRRSLELANHLKDLPHSVDPVEIENAVKNALEGISGALVAPLGMTTAKDAVLAFADRLSDAYNNGDIPGLSTGIEILDAASGGAKPGELWIVGAETSGGKSVLMLQIAAHNLAQGKRVLIFSLEMMATEVIGRLVSCYGRIPFGHITQPRSATKFSIGKIQSAAEEIKGWELMIDEREKLTAAKIEAECYRQRDQHGKIDMVLVDYLQLVSAERGRNEARHEEISRVSKCLKNLAKSLKCPVLTASQLNDDGKLRESRDPSFDADAVLLIGSDGIKAAKLRNAPRGQILPLELNGEFQRFDKMEPQQTTPRYGR